MFMLPSIPSPEAEREELADFVELQAWRDQRVSQREIVAALGREEENEGTSGCEDEDDSTTSLMGEVMNELQDRALACGSGYPFEINENGTAVRFDSGSCSPKSALYLYLLLSTRLNMRVRRNHGGIDGALLLEKVASSVLRHYLGPVRARSTVFGTAVSGGFAAKVNSLCDELGEGGGFKNLDPEPTHAVDGKLDAVAWVPFSDRRPGQLIVFAQCKTGTSWRDSTAKLQPDSFIRKWFRDAPIVGPVRAFCVSEALKAHWMETGNDAGLVLDRCRLVDFFDGSDKALLDEVRIWTDAAWDDARTSIASA